MKGNNRIRKIATIAAAIILIVAIIHVIVFIFFNVSGKSILKKYIKNNFAAEAEVSSVSFRFPFTVVVKGFKCNDVAFSRADISLGLFNPISSHISLRKIYINDLNFKVKIEKEKVSIDPVFIKKTIKEEPQAQPQELKTIEKPEKPKQKNISVSVGMLSINNATAQILDLTKDQPVIFTLNNVNVRLKHFVYPALPKFYVEINASLEKESIKTNNIIMIKGWVDYAHRNMDLKFNINNADYSLFSEYYPPFWKPDNLGIKKAQLSLDTLMNSLNNDLTIEAVLSLDNIEFVENAQDNSKANNIKTMINFFKVGDEKPTLPIKLRTKMDSFNIDFSSLQSEVKGKMKVDIGTVIFNILDKAKNKVKATTKDVKAITVDKAVDTTKETVGTVTDVTVNKAVNAVKDVVGSVREAIKASKEESAKEPTQPLQSQEGAVPKAEVGLQESGTQTGENPSTPVEGNIQNVTQSQNGTPGAQVTTQEQNQTQNTPVDNQNQNTTQITQPDTQSQTQPAQ